MPGLILDNISKSFDKTVALDGISLELQEGELLVILGPSGCGKSTLLRLIAGLEELDSGEIYIGDKRVDKLRPKDRNVSMVFQNYSLYPHMSVEKNLAFPLKIAKKSKAYINKQVTETAELLDLSDKLKSRPGELSGGQRQRVAVGRAIIRNPAIFLLDEPFSNLDANLRTKMRREIVRLQKNLNTTTVHVTHDQAEALTMADRIALLDKGKLVQLGTPEELYSSPVNVFVADFLGYPKINLINGKIKNGVLHPFGHEVPFIQNKKINTAVIIGIRPEIIEISENGQFEGKAIDSIYIGDQHVIMLDYNSSKIVVSGQKHPIKNGKTVTFNFDLKKALYFNGSNGDCISKIK